MSLRDLPSNFVGWIDREQLRDLLLESDGRIGRQQYWRAWLAWVVAWALFAVVFFLTGWLPYLAIGLAILFSLLVLSSSIFVGRKRLHDRDKSGGWLLLFYLGPVVLSGIGDITGRIGFVFELPSLLVVIWMFVELGCLPGTPGPNKYGPDPLSVSPELPASV